MGSKIHAALILARAEFGKAEKDAKNPHFKNRYPSLGSMMEACDEALRNHGLSYVQPVVIPNPEMGPILRTILCHAESGETIESEFPLLIGSAPNPMQGLGSALTYARRYSLESLLGLAREDDDGNAAHPSTSNYQPPQRQPAPPPPPADVALTPFDIWLGNAAGHLGVTSDQLLLELHDRAVENRNFPPCHADKRLALLGAKYHDAKTGRDWRDWMKGVCKEYQKKIASAV